MCVHACVCCYCTMSALIHYYYYYSNIHINRIGWLLEAKAKSININFIETKGKRTADQLTLNEKNEKRRGKKEKITKRESLVVFFGIFVSCARFNSTHNAAHPNTSICVYFLLLFFLFAVESNFDACCYLISGRRVAATVLLLCACTPCTSLCIIRFFVGILERHQAFNTFVLGMWKVHENPFVCACECTESNETAVSHMHHHIIQSISVQCASEAARAREAKNAKAIYTG